ncbi:P2X purinoceptor 7 isoform X3 [Nerophis lumbriciformis]|uniref:P2X purinoceptor 7 isoform X3 n=1 Tax=Nerophis lumbriciformis TaxID=546530 RepID=UPI002ADF5AA8|nr:P2X purinoceptor 7-like isoform X3 [Nerophis lumbriciformis]
MACALCTYETNKLVRIHSVRLGSLKWSLNATILLGICLVMLWNRKYQHFDQVVSSVTAKVKGVALMHLPGQGGVVWDVADYSRPSQDKKSFLVVTNVIVTNKQKQGRCPEPPVSGRLCRHDNDCDTSTWSQHSNGIQTGLCVKFDALTRTCEVTAWCPIETKTRPPRPAVLASAENFTVLIKNNIRFPAFNFIRLGDVVRQAGQNFSQMAVEGGVIGIQIKWDCNLDLLTRRCLPRYSFRRLDENESNKTLYPGFNFRFAKYNMVDGVEERTLYKAFGIRFDILVFGQAGKFSIIQLVVYIGSTLSYYALTTVLMDWLIQTSCYSADVGQNYGEKKVESVEDGKKGVLSVSYVDQDHIRVVKMSLKRRLQDANTVAVETRREDAGHVTMAVSVLQAQVDPRPVLKPDTERQSWCGCGRCTASALPQEELCCRRSEGPCISSSALFERLVLHRPLLEALLLYRDPLSPAPAATSGHSTATLRHCAYQQYVAWRFGVPPAATCPAIPRCCVGRIREEFPSPDGRYSGFTLANATPAITTQD